MRSPILVAAALALAACDGADATSAKLDQCKADIRAAVALGIADLKRDAEERANALTPPEDGDHPEVKEAIASLNEFGGNLMRRSVDMFAAYAMPLVEAQIEALPGGADGLDECEELLAKVQRKLSP